jgi:hypothetical protein
MLCVRTRLKLIAPIRAALKLFSPVIRLKLDHEPGIDTIFCWSRFVTNESNLIVISGRIRPPFPDEEPSWTFPSRELCCQVGSAVPYLYNII